MNSTYSRSNFSKIQKNSANLFSRVAINTRFIICSLKEECPDFDMYKGIDMLFHKWVHIYIKPKANIFTFPKVNIQGSMSQIFPGVLDSGEAEIFKQKYYYEIHQIYGPALPNILKKVNRTPNARQILHLLLQMVKLIEKIDHLKLVCGQLMPQSIVFDSNPKKNDLYLSNCFGLKRKNHSKVLSKNKYSSRAVHLGLKNSIKDDLESVCYILIDVFTSGAFLNQKQPQQFEQDKLSQKVLNFASGLPKPFIDFYYSVTNLNYSDQFDYYYWKKYLINTITPEVTYRPYGFLTAKADSIKKFNTQDLDTNEDSLEMLQEEDGSRSNNFQKMQRVLSSKRKLT